MGRMTVIAVVAVLWSAEAAAEESDHVLFFCMDEVLGAEGECARLEAAFGTELADFGVHVVRGSIGEKLAEGIQLPPAVAAVTQESGALGAVWLTPGVNHGTDGLVMHVYTPDNLQVISKIVAECGEEGTLDHGDVAFRLRTFLGASLYSDMPEFDLPEPEPVAAGTMPYILDDVGPPEDEPEKPGKRLRVRLAVGYIALGYPTRPYWFHGASFRLGVLAHPAFEIFVDGAVTVPLTLSFTSSSGETMELENRQSLMGIGAGYTFQLARPIAITPRAGLHLGLSDTRENWTEQKRHKELNAAVWVGLELLLMPVRWLAINLAVSIENLFNYEYFEWQIEGGPTRTFSLAQFRMNIVAGVCVSF
ncbi:MAG: hypothetical protein JRG91_20085 [Deltaproteobacteria bacterium]|nr:hypothetical protein [Deltaproteobacteria bacterium]